MKNYFRYKKMTEEKYYKKGLLYYLVRKPGDKTLFNWINKIKSKTVLEVGAGYGYYTKHLMKNNTVEAVDINPDLCKNLGITVYGCSASDIDVYVKKSYDCVCSFWMTEYLDNDELRKFIYNGCGMLKESGHFLSTIIIKKGLGRLYILGAKIKRINKYNYTYKDIVEIVPEGYSARFIKVKGIWGIPFAILLDITRNKE